jgi:hypothetical protein
MRQSSVSELTAVFLNLGPLVLYLHVSTNISVTVLYPLLCFRNTERHLIKTDVLWRLPVLETVGVIERMALQFPYSSCVNSRADLMT